MVVPLLDRGRIVAVAGVGNKASDYDSADERQIALLLGGMWAHVQRQRAQEALQQAHDELEQRVQKRTAELADALEELQVAQEELREQNEELLSSRALVESERQRYASLFDLAPDGYLVTDPAGITFDIGRNLISDPAQYLHRFVAEAGLDEVTDIKGGDLQIKVDGLKGHLPGLDH